MKKGGKDIVEEYRAGICPKCGYLQWDLKYKYCGLCGTEMIDISDSFDRKAYIKETWSANSYQEALIGVEYVRKAIYPNTLDEEAVQNRLDIALGIKENTLPDPNLREKAIAKATAPTPTYVDPYASNPQCPYCKSRNTKKITTGSRLFSTGLFGLGSSKVGKNYHCNNCKSDF